MAETYCGKSCAECAQKEALNCQGCKAGPGGNYGWGCDLAQCVINKGHETCDSCGFKDNCGTLRSRDRMAVYRLERIAAEEQRKIELANLTPELGKWLWILFWLIIPGTIAGLMTNALTMELAPSLYLPGTILNILTTAAHGMILIHLASEEERYRTAGLCTLIAGGVNILVAFVSRSGEIPPWTLLLSIPASIISFVGEYNVYMAHAAVLKDVDNALSAKWEKLWKWYIRMFAAMIVGIPVILLLPFLGVLVILGGAVGIIVVSVLKLLYLYRTAKIFRAYPCN